MAFGMGWKDILRPIRDGYRHLFPSPDTGPTPAERARQRALDRWKGFAYFDTFAELESWSETESDALQRANTPLLRRSDGPANGDDMKAKVVICHDYAGNYHDYEASQGVGVDEESYACEYLQFVDTFIYFSHKLVCIPPPSWTNTLHRNGVKTLGTLLIEPQTPDAERLLHRSESSSDDCFPMAERLARLSAHYGFDGWLVNIEKAFPKEHWDANVLESFLRQLKQALGQERILIWYDALTSRNQVEYQNALTLKNLAFSKACGAVLTNYSWTEANAQSSKQLALQHAMDPRDIYFGIDVWAQNTTKLTHPRVTYPKNGGGGTNTGIAVAKLADEGLSATLFAPAWSFEHFPGHRTIVERAAWDGQVLPDDLQCSCGNARKCHPDNPGFPIVGAARQYAAGSEHFFYTDFTRAFGKHDDESSRMLYGKKSAHSQLGSQSVLPHLTRTSESDGQVESAINVLSMRLEELPNLTQLAVDVRSFATPADDRSIVYERWLPLFTLDMAADGSLIFQAKYRYKAPNSGAQAAFYLKFSDQVTLLALQETVDFNLPQAPVASEESSGKVDQLLEIGIHLTSPILVHAAAFIEVREISIVPYMRPSSPPNCSILNIRLEHRRNLDKEHWRVCWDFHDESEETFKSAGQPYSRVTGPFAYFLVEFGELSTRAYTLEWILSPMLEQLVMDKGAEVSIVGIGFDGRRLARAVSQLPARS